MYQCIRLFHITVFIMLIGLMCGTCFAAHKKHRKDTSLVGNETQDIIPPSLVTAQSWGYWLQKITISAIPEKKYEVMVIDYSRDGTDATAFKKEAIEQIKASGKIVLCYLSIGEAESYRFYWKNAWVTNPPSWLGPVNPAWPGNYKVKYWINAWWETALRPYLDTILAQGFHGVYLDIIDAYYYWSDHGYPVTTTANQMCALIEKIDQYGQSIYGKTNPNQRFIVCPQNGESIIDDSDPEWKERYFNHIQAIGIEDLFYNCTLEDQMFRLNLLKEFRSRSIPIFNIEYIPTQEHAAYYTRAKAEGMIPFAAKPDRQLDELP